MTAGENSCNNTLIASILSSLSEYSTTTSSTCSSTALMLCHLGLLSPYPRLDLMRRADMDTNSLSMAAIGLCCVIINIVPNAIGRLADSVLFSSVLTTN